MDNETLGTVNLAVLTDDALRFEQDVARLKQLVELQNRSRVARQIGRTNLAKSLEYDEDVVKRS